MKKQAEILAPAGNMEAFQAAVAAGADAVYLGLPAFGARAFAENFTVEQVKEVIEQAHLAGMKLYVTMNTLLEEDQFPAAFEQARTLYELGADALIVQDLGLIHYLHHRLPDLELHASTQISAVSPFQMEQLARLGISRVVLAREASLEEIEAAAKTGMELEVFVHGALCISYSGQCQFSRVRYGRSGNKGACAQPCRMEYTLKENGKPVSTSGSFLLSPRDLSVLQDISALEKAGVASLKIEGRMKSPAYVYEAVLKARKAREGKTLDAKDRAQLMSTFNRGYTRGHLFSQQGNALMNSRTSNHQGVEIGKVIKVTPKKITMELYEDLNQNDGIRFESKKQSAGMRVNFLYENDKLTSSVKKGHTAQVDAIKGVYPGAVVRRTVDSSLEKEVDHAIHQQHRQSDIAFSLKNAGPDHPLILQASDGQHTVQVQSKPVQAAKSRPTSREDFIKQLSKTGNTWAHAAAVDVELAADIFVPIKEINALRNEAIEALRKEKLQVNAKAPLDYTYQPPKVSAPCSLIEVQKKPQADAFMNWKQNHQNTQAEQKEEKKEETECQAKADSFVQISEMPVEAVSEFPIAAVETKIPIHDRQTAGQEKPALVSAHLDQARYVDGMNITNAYALAALLELGYEGAVLSEELSEKGRQDLMDNFKARYGFEAPVIQTVYEHPRLMLMNHCPVNTALKDGDRKNCSLCRKNDYVLEGKDGRRVHLYGSKDCRMRLYDETAADTIDELEAYEKQGIHAFRIALSQENPEQVEQLLSRLDQNAKQQYMK